MRNGIAIAKYVSLMAAILAAVPLALVCAAVAFPPSPSECPGDICDPYGLWEWILYSGFVSAVAVLVAVVTWAICLVGGSPSGERLTGLWTQVLKLDALLLLAVIFIWVTDVFGLFGIFCLTVLASMAYLVRRNWVAAHR